ncbi:MAG: cadmium resistance transporter [Woronichinia naegeliana WA131]|jgi:cadmium resistance transport/sequestration family protein|uniref:Cadmium resistance transporter n=1 Tax=Woronichinia naegeliana WA131 TaxID=2824559 RepID=A0A977KZD4_9CYAN|nr:MAG: cadmium resistance transporter [Woronichinia naegeliana WA131]
MESLLQVIVAAIAAFAATNIDDILILMFFFSQVNSSFRIHHIILGQYLGFMGLLLLSLPGFLGGLIIPKAWTGLLGLIPIYIGLQQILNPETQTPEIPSIASGKRSQPKSSGLMSYFNPLLAPQTYSVAAITLANGGDNIGIYVPFFASLSWFKLLVVITTFLSLVGVWCAIAYGLTRQPMIGKVLNRYGHKVVPFVLIGLGLLILWDSQSYELLKLLNIPLP